MSPLRLWAVVRRLANDAGCKVFECGPGFGGRYGYVSADHPNCRICGFKTKREAREAWMTDTFGEHATAALLRILSALTPEPRHER